MKKAFYLLYSTVCYIIFFATILYLIGFVENLYVPKSVNTGKETTIPVAILINLGLISLFGIQHSVMARKGFKKMWTTIIPEPIERSTYVLIASIMVILLMYFWKPIPVEIWNLSDTVAGAILIPLSFAGWGILFVSTFLINHFHLFGLQQVYQHAIGKEQRTLRFRTPFLYKLVRHPLYLGFIIAFWATPVMTAGHLLFSACMTIYIFIGIYHEEKDLVKMYGSEYHVYRENTARVIPFTKL
jgi:methanethiol S-methyltransferase